MTEMNDVEDTLGEMEAEESKSVQTATDELDGVPDNWKKMIRGKSIKEVANILVEHERIISRQGQEVGEVRRLADELLKSQLSVKKVEEKQPDVDIFDDPQGAINQAVSRHPDVVDAKKIALQMQREHAVNLLTTKHPDKDVVLNDSEFVDWIKSSKVRSELFNRAHSNYDFDAADELLTTFKELKEIRKQKVVKQTSESEKAARDETLKAASVDSGGSGESSKKIYYREDLMELMLRDKRKYDSMIGSIERAYSEGRVRSRKQPH